MTVQPNILFLQVDQLSANALRCYGNLVCKTPNLDRLARDGVVFDNAYCNFPLCAPSRASMATGQLCSTIGAYDNAAELPAHIPTYAHYLRDLGYETILSGKMHFIGPDQHHGFEKRLTPDLYPADFAWVPNWKNEGKRDTNDARGVTISGVAAHTVQMEFDDLVTRSAISELEDIARGESDRPFFLQVSWTHPHEPFLCRPEFWDLYDGIDIPLPAVGSLSEADHDAHSVRILSDFGMLEYPFTDEEIIRARRAYYGSISYIDKMVGDLLSVLDATGLSQNTAIVFTSDHGEMLGERGIWFKKHFFEDALKIPLILSAPWITEDPITTPVSLVDLLPTFCGLARGVPWDEVVEPIEGTDLTAIIAAPEQSADRTVYAEYLAEATPEPIFMIRRGAYKFVTSKADPPLLFDVENDPNELENLALNPACANLLAEFQAQAEEKWNAAALKDDILLSQRRRALVRSASSKGQEVRWNHDEEPGQTVPWYRGQGSYNEWAFAFTPDQNDDE